MLTEAWHLFKVIAGTRLLSQLHFPPHVRWLARVPRLLITSTILAVIVAVSDLRWTLILLGILVSCCLYILEDYLISLIEPPEEGGGDEPGN